MKETIYILELANDNYYVGRTDDVVTRFNQHKNGLGSSWTKEHLPCKLIDVHYSTSKFDEDKYTLEYMNKYSIDKVRGGSYVTKILSDEQINAITKSLRTANDQCLECGSNNHFVKYCNKRKNYKTKNTSVKEPETFFGKMMNGMVESLVQYNENTVERACSRCLRVGHTRDKCYAKTDTYGNKL
jgi:predicted GIY-YIG superfamily endonuclease